MFIRTEPIPSLEDRFSLSAQAGRRTQPPCFLWNGFGNQAK